MGKAHKSTMPTHARGNSINNIKNYQPAITAHTYTLEQIPFASSSKILAVMTFVRYWVDNGKRPLSPEDEVIKELKKIMDSQIVHNGPKLEGQVPSPNPTIKYTG